ncbi:hypothetical protein [Arthrobacter sp. SD76]|uniref:hypothetical protein n=1 Tax=Arthrobacter sp. SD76 TaxID=3415007 RepID=UPI003C727CFF
MSGAADTIDKDDHGRDPEKTMHTQATESTDPLIDAKKHRKARRLGWVSVALLFVAALLTPYRGPWMGVLGLGVMGLGIALIATNQIKWRARTLAAVGAAFVVTGVVFTVGDVTGVL